MSALVADAGALFGLQRDALAERLRAGLPVDPARIAGSDYRGVSLGLPGFVERLTWKTFRKSFRADGDRVRGLNVRLLQTGIDAAPEPRRERRGAPVTFGPFLVSPLPAHGTPFGCERGVVFDYGATHPAWHPIARTRDVVVALDEACDVLLGALYVEIGGLRLRTPSFFTLERERA